jgi:RHS repeat-associated protein
VHNPSNGTWSSQETVTNLPWGDATTNSSGAPLSDHDFFADFIQDQDGEFQSMTRRYSAVQGRWTTPDPAGQAAVDPANPQTWNRYAYVINNPVGLTDPSGLCTLRSLCQALVGMFDTNCPIWAGGACPPALPGWDEFDLMEIPVVGGGAGSGSQSVTSYDYQYVPGSFSLMQNFDSEGNPILDASGNSTYTIQETTGGWQLIGANLSPPTTSGGGGILFWLQGFAANNGTPNPNTPVVQQDNGKSKPNVPPEWGFCSGYRDGTGAGDAMYHLCMSFPNGPWSNCVRGKLLNQWTPNPNPFQLVWYLGPDHAYDFATCAIQ